VSRIASPGARRDSRAAAPNPTEVIALPQPTVHAVSVSPAKKLCSRA